MSKKFKEHPVLPDPVYNDILVAKFINQVMRKGKRTLARKIVYQAFDLIKNQTKKEPLEIFNQGLRNASPLLEVRPRRIGGATYQVPREVREKRRMSLAMRWIIEAARAKKGKGMAQNLAQELLEASQEKGEAVRKKINIHRMAQANKAFAYLAR